MAAVISEGLLVRQWGPREGARWSRQGAVRLGCPEMSKVPPKSQLLMRFDSGTEYGMGPTWP